MSLGSLPNKFTLFCGQALGQVLDQRKGDLVNAILSMDRNEFLNANEPDLIKYFTDIYTYELAFIDFGAIELTEREATKEEIECGHLVYKNGQLCSFHLPISGEIGLLQMSPSTKLQSRIEVCFNGTGEIWFDLFCYPGAAEQVKNYLNEINKTIQENLVYANNDLMAHNEIVKQHIPEIIRERKEDILEQLKTVETIGVPLRKKDNAPKTFTVPTVKRKAKIVERPKSSSAEYVPDPALDDRTYLEILKLISEFGVEMERHPLIYEAKDEECLRDHFIMMLSPHFEGGVTGETFNKSGKTDILVRYESSNVFVAECKYWRGQKAYLDAIDQTLGYLTWRDSKAAIICFVDNVELNPVLQKIIECTPTHNSHVETLEESDGCYRYRFHLKNDSTRNVFLTIICFHFPKSKL